MEPIYCPNGHPNRPGTRLCIVCRALIPPAAGPSSPPPATEPKAASSAPLPPVHAPPKTAPPAAPPTPASPPRPVAPPATPEAPVAATPSGRAWLWLLAGLLIIGVVVAALFVARLWPSRATGALPTSAPTAPAVTTAPAVAAVTDAPPLATAPAATTAPPTTTNAPATTAPTAVATITPLPVIVGVVITPTLVFEPGDNLLQNGEFTADWINGWVSESSGRAGLAEVRPLSDEPGTPALRMEKTGAGLLQLGQRVVLTTPIDGLVFRARVRLSGTWSPTAEGRGAVILRYEDAAGQALATSVWLDGAVETSALWGQGPLPPPSPTTAVRFIETGWQDLELDLRSEFDEALAGADATAVRQITILLALLGGDDCGETACAASVDAAALSLSAGAP